MLFELGLLGIKSEVSDAERAKWNQSFFFRDKILKHSYYLTTVQRRDIPSAVMTGYIKTGRAINLNLPLEREDLKDWLAQNAYLATTEFGMIVPEKLREFSQSNADHILAALNRNQLGTTGDAQDQFYNDFSFQRWEEKNRLRVGGEEIIRIEAFKGGYRMKGETVEDVIRLSRKIERTFPHLQIAPLPVDNFLARARQTLQFLTQEWGN